MQFTPLTVVQHRLEIGAPLPFNIRDNDGTLLLARGQWLSTVDQRDALFNRGALVDLAELRSSAQTIALAKPDELPGLWSRCMNDLAQALRHSAKEGFVAALDEAAPPVLALRRVPALRVVRQHKKQGLRWSALMKADGRIEVTTNGNKRKRM